MDYTKFDTDFNITDRVAIVTGGSSGIGLAVAKLFNKKGAQVVIFDINPATPTIAQEINSTNMAGYVVDITDKASIDSALDKVERDIGKVDILANAAGTVFIDNAEDLGEKEWDKTFEINTKGTFLMAQAVGKRMLKHGIAGKIVNIASQGTRVALAQHVAYCASKAAVVSMTQVMALEWGPAKINVNCVSPTIIYTELSRPAWDGEEGEAMRQQIPLRRFGYPEEVAASMLYLVTDAAILITGENLVIDGGYSVR